VTAAVAGDVAEWLTVRDTLRLEALQKRDRKGKLNVGLRAELADLERRDLEHCNDPAYQRWQEQLKRSLRCPLARIRRTLGPTVALMRIRIRVRRLYLRYLRRATPARGRTARARAQARAPARPRPAADDAEPLDAGRAA
jgi:hypothetical protein